MMPASAMHEYIINKQQEKYLKYITNMQVNICKYIYIIYVIHNIILIKYALPVIMALWQLVHLSSPM